MPQDENRRPLASRKIRLFHHLAKQLDRWGITPNAISIGSVVFALGAAILLLQTDHLEGIPQRLCWLGAAACIQMRLLCNLVDGLVAVECGKASPLGELFNEVPDRIADVVILAGCGWAEGGDPQLSLTAAMLAVLVAYVRAIGAATAKIQAFQGPMAKPQRMFVVTLACLAGGLLPMHLQAMPLLQTWSIARLAMLIIILGCLVTTVRRLLYVAHSMRTSI